MSGQMTGSESVMTDELISRARAGDAVAFQKLTESHRVPQGVGVIAVSLSGERICALTFFEQSALPWFGLPLSLPTSASDSRAR